MNDNKYYTPSIEEFYEGFEYEMKANFGDGTVKTQEQYDNAKWGPCTYSLRSFPYVDRTMTGKNSQNLPAAIRVKYLDREDIEDCKFKFKETNGMCSWYETEFLGERLPNESVYSFWKAYIMHDPKRKTVKLEADVDNGEREIFFEGVINNKSQLKQILQWTGILK